jgi:hypothetical protein
MRTGRDHVYLLRLICLATCKTILGDAYFLNREKKNFLNYAISAALTKDFKPILEG